MQRDNEQVGPGVNQGTRSAVFSGVRWAGGALLFNRLARFLSMAVLARLLVPEMFGLVTMATASMQVLGAIREIGIGSAFVQRKYADQDETALAADSTFVLSLLMNGALAGVAWIMAPWIASFFQEMQSELTLILRVMFSLFLLEPFMSTPMLLLQKGLAFEKLASAEICAALVQGVVSIVLALFDFGAWSLVYGLLAARLVQTLLLMRFAHWSPRLRYDKHLALDLFGYGKYLWAFAAISAVGGALDKMVIGREFGKEELGFYGLAFTLCMLPTQFVTSLVKQIAFPALAKIKDDPAGLSDALEEALSYVALMALPIGFGLLSVAEPFVLSVYGQQWRESIPLVRILAFFGLIISVSSVTGPVFKAVGKPDLILWTGLIHQGVLFAMLYTLLGLGLQGIALAILIPQVLSATLAFAWISKLLVQSPRRFVTPILLATLPAALMSLLCSETYVLLHPLMRRSIALTITISIGVLAYVALSLLLNRRRSQDFLLQIRKIIAGGVRRTRKA